MSFQDVGKSNSHRRAASASMQQQQQRHQQTSQPSTISGASTWSSGFGTLTGLSMSSSSPPSIAQISESLTQYQRNVGILEKIAQSLQQQTQQQTTKGNANGSTIDELEQQYRVQLDVLRQLEQRVRDQFQTQKKMQGAVPSSSTATALIKLERDFERVQATAQSCRARVTKLQKQQQQRKAAAANQTATANAFQQEQKKFQLQLQEDRLHEEMMREREEEIRNINKGMHKVNEIYKDLAHIVGTQQDHVDQIETQMENAKSNAENGLEQVQKANDRYGQSQCIIS